MVIGIIGESCTGKSAIAERLREQIGGEVVTGKDYLKLAKSESMAEILFKKKLLKAVEEETVIYVISEKDQLKLLPESAVRVLVTADLETIKKRFAARMNGNLPDAVGKMLERKHGMFDGESARIKVHNDGRDLQDICSEIMRITGK